MNGQQGYAIYVRLSRRVWKRWLIFRRGKNGVPIGTGRQVLILVFFIFFQVVWDTHLDLTACQSVFLTKFLVTRRWWWQKLWWAIFMSRWRESLNFCQSTSFLGGFLHLRRQASWNRLRKARRALRSVGKCVYEQNWLRSSLAVAVEGFTQRSILGHSC